MNRYSRYILVATLVLFLSCAASADDVGFTGNYGVGNFTINANGGSGGVNLGGAPANITITGNNNGSSGIDTTFTTTAAYSGTITFDWRYTSQDGDTGFDFPFYIVVGGNTVLCCDSVVFGQNASGNGTISFHINAGETFGWGVHSVDGIFGAGSLTISNFQSVGDVPEPASLFLLGTGMVGAVGTLRKRLAKR